MTNEKIKKYLEEMKKIANEADEDRENAHMEADDLLCSFLLELGYTELVELYESFGKWYA
jgi:hypothetical protein